MNGVSPDFGWQMICFLIGTLGVVSVFLQAMNSRRSQSRHVALIEEFVTRKEMSAFEGKVDARFENLRGEMREDKTELLAKGEERAVKIHDRINLVLGAVSRMEGRLDK